VDSGGSRRFETRIDGDAIIFEEIGQLHRGFLFWNGSRAQTVTTSLSRSGSNGSAASLPSAFLSKISTRHGRFERGFWTSRGPPRKQFPVVEILLRKADGKLAAEPFDPERESGVVTVARGSVPKTKSPR